MPTNRSCNAFVSSNRCCCLLICCNKSLPTVPTPTTKRLSTCDSERKKESCMTLSALRRLPSAITKDILVSEAPCAQAITLIPLRPKTLNSFPAIPGVCFIFSPTIATVARSFSASIALISPTAISWRNSSRNTFTANSASALRTANVVLFSDDACDTKKTLIPDFASRLNIRELIPMTPTMPIPDKVMRHVSLIDEIPLMAFPSACELSSEMRVPGAEGLKVFLMNIGIFL